MFYFHDIKGIENQIRLRPKREGVDRRRILFRCDNASDELILNHDLPLE